MALHTQQSVSGFIASEPQRSVTENGDTRFYARIGQPHFRRNDDGTFTELEPASTTWSPTAPPPNAHSPASPRATASSPKATSAPSRSNATARSSTGEEFVAKKIGHDLARTNYDVDRTRRRAAAVERRYADAPSAGAVPQAHRRARNVTAGDEPSAPALRAPHLR